MKHAIFIKKTESGTFGGYAPGLPGVGVTGDTKEKARQLLTETIAFHLEGLHADGLPTPQPSVEID